MSFFPRTTVWPWANTSLKCRPRFQSESYQKPEATRVNGWTARKRNMNQFLPLSEKAQKHTSQPKEWKLVALRECPMPESMMLCDKPEIAAVYWRTHIVQHPHFNPECECFAVLWLNTRKRIRGHQLISIGTMDCLLVHPREVFRGAIAASAAGIVLAHNHPSGEPQPSEADIKVTRDLIRAGQLLKIEVVDHIVIGNPDHRSIRELGYFA